MMGGEKSVLKALRAIKLQHKNKAVIIVYRFEGI